MITYSSDIFFLQGKLKWLEIQKNIINLCDF